MNFLTKKINQSSTTLQAFMNKENSFLQKAPLLMIHKQITYGQMHQYKNVIQERHKHIGQIINPFIFCFQNTQLIMFPNLYYHTIPQNDLITHKCTYHKIIYIYIYIYVFIYIHINAHVYVCTCTPSYLLARPQCEDTTLVQLGKKWYIKNSSLVSSWMRNQFAHHGCCHTSTNNCSIDNNLSFCSLSLSFSLSHTHTLFLSFFLRFSCFDF